MKITVPYEFTESVMPPRCRKPREVRKAAEITLQIHEVSDSEAPIAIRHHGQTWNAQHQRVPEIIEYRWWNRQLWRLYGFQRVSRGPQETQTIPQFQADHKMPSYCRESYGSKQSRRVGLMSWARSILFVDGVRWSEATEPRYVVMTFGLGHNHGIGWGTSLSTDTVYNPNISKDRYFRIDQFEAAVSAASRIAANRGDTKALPIVETQHPDTFDILIPEAVRLKPNKEHGRGCEFLNKAEQMIEAAGNPVVAAFGLMALL